MFVMACNVWRSILSNDHLFIINCIALLRFYELVGIDPETFSGSQSAVIKNIDISQIIHQGWEICFP
jgi:hypothetical protein